MELTHSEVRKILELIDQAEHVEEFELSVGDVHVHIRRRGAEGTVAAVSSSAPGLQGAQPIQLPPAAVTSERGAVAPAPTRPNVPVAAVTEIPAGMIAVRAPLLGTFYRAPSPSEPPFVEIGQRVNVGDTLCVIEVMKLFKSVTSDVAGVVRQIAVENAGVVEFEQILFVIEPN